MIYLDNNATTMVDPQVAAAILTVLTEAYGNPSSAHAPGRRAAALLERARGRVAGLLGAKADEIIFTSCGTESDNMAVISAMRALPDKKHFVTSQVEHPGVGKMADWLESIGYAVTRLAVDERGRLDVRELEQALRPDTFLVSLMHANNETGVLFPLAEIAELVKSRGILLHVDAVQSVGKVPLDLRGLPLDYLALSGHKLHGPKGVGALYARRGAPRSPLLLGGGQEGGWRPGTENVAYAVGLGLACELAARQLAEGGDKIKSLRDKLENGLLRSIPDSRVNGDRDGRLPNTSSLALGGVNALDLLEALDQRGICASGGSACHAGRPEPSSVLLAMGVAREYALGTLRLSLSRFNTEEEIDGVLEVLPELARALRWS